MKGEREINAQETKNKRHATERSTQLSSKIIQVFSIRSRKYSLKSAKTRKKKSGKEIGHQNRKRRPAHETA